MDHIGFIGLGRMGQRMAARLLAAGARLTVYDVLPEKCRPLRDQGAAIARTPRDLGGLQAVVSSVSDGPAVLSALEGPEGLLAGSRRGLLLLEMSTIGVEDSQRVAAACEPAGVSYVRSPVPGTLDSAAAGKLTALVSAPRPAFDAALPLLQRLSAEQQYLGAAEEGRVMKLLINGLLGAGLAAFAEVLAIGQKAGLDRRQLLAVIGASAMASPAIKGTAASLRDPSFEPRLTTTLLTKDLRLLNELAASNTTPAPMASLSFQLFEAAANMGWAESDTSAVVLLLETLSGIKP